MNRLPLIVAAGAALLLGVAVVAVSSSFVGEANDEPAIQLAQATTDKDDDKNEADKPESEEADAEADKDSKEEGESMSEDKAAEPTAEDAEAFKQTMHEGDVALGVCGARMSALLWFYEASVAQGRDDLKGAVESLTVSRSEVKKEAERRAVEDKVDTSVRVMNDESERLWNELNEKAEGDEKEFQAAHDELVAGVQECLNLFFDRPDGAAKDKDGEADKPKDE